MPMTTKCVVIGVEELEITCQLKLLLCDLCKDLVKRRQGISSMLNTLRTESRVIDYSTRLLLRNLQPVTRIWVCSK